MNVPETFFSVREELFLFIISCLSGMIIGLCYDVLRTFRSLFYHGVWLCSAEDIAFLTFYAVFLSAFASVAARGELRFYYIVGNILGATLYFLTLGSIITRLLKKLLKFFSLFFKVISAPIMRLYVLLRKKARVKFVGSSKNIKKTIKMLNLLSPNQGMLRYNKMENKKRKNVNNVAKKN